MKLIVQEDHVLLHASFDILNAECGLFKYNPVSNKYSISHLVLDWLAVNGLDPLDFMIVNFFDSKQPQGVCLRFYTLNQAMDFKLRWG